VKKHTPEPHDAVADWERSHTRGADLDVLALEESRVEYDAASRERHSTAAGRSSMTARRLATAAERDENARLRDLSAAARDRAAQADDDLADARERLLRSGRRAQPKRASRASSAWRARTRVSGASTRRQAAFARRAAAADRQAAAADRDQSAADRRLAGLDELTGVLRRGTGDLALMHDLSRARRSGTPLVIAAIDVDALKAVNDHDGHAAGDALLRDVATAIGSAMRSYDVIVRWGGDEFICALSDVTLEVGSRRVAEIQRSLDERRPRASISAGLAELTPDDTLETLIARADDALYRTKASGRG
jgi:diguanylate cyclase (GGDEF)-like protein